MGGPLNVDFGANHNEVIALLKFENSYFGAVRYFFFVVQKDFFPNHFSRKKPFGLVRQFVFWKIRWVQRQQFKNTVKYLLGIGLVERRNRNNGRRVKFFLPIRYFLLDLLVSGLVNFIDKYDYRAVGAGQGCERVVFVVFFKNIGHKQHHVSIFERAVHKFHHGFVELVHGLDNARRVRINQLKLGIVVNTVQDAHDAVARGLGFGGNNGEPLAHQHIHQSGLAHIGLAYDTYKTRAVVGVVVSH